MTSEKSSSTPDATVKQQEKSEASKDRITLRKKASLGQGTPQHIYILYIIYYISEFYWYDNNNRKYALKSGTCSIFQESCKFIKIQKKVEMMLFFRLFNEKIIEYDKTRAKYEEQLKIHQCIIEKTART
ncbi:hypothetical protein AYI69_g9970 [Smittium culicis]|uniref:Uncharacterized protein n=1 Tax=Smittium culicis TaxID=133412 RepID=A0A1R1X904_9FUNG|nr:hypothetical protein AYI69_g9970 [Smittium culicis]